MYLFDTNMPMLVFVITIVEISLLYSQWVGYLSRPYEAKRKYHSCLLLILILYNIAEGFFPDSKIPVATGLQNFLGYGFGYLIAAYCPFYFYKTLGIPGLGFHGKYGPLFILVPLIVCYGILYPIHGDIQLTRKQVYYVPGIYAGFVYWITIKEIFRQYKINNDRGLLYERICIYMSVFPVCITPLLGGFLGLAKWLITTIFNVGFLIVNSIFMRQLVRQAKGEYIQLQELNTSLNEKVKERTRQLEQANEKQRNTFNNLVHETKTPLTLVNNYLEEYIQNNGTGEDLAVLKGAVNKLTRDMIGLMDIEKFNRGIAVYKHNQALDFSGILKESWSLFEPYIKKQGFEAHADIDDEIYIKADPQAIYRIINNLIDNAIKFSDAGGIISVSLKLTEGRIIFKVSDMGKGIAISQQKKIFDPYYQINHETTSIQGMGLGLPIVKKVVDGLKGEISIDSDPPRKVGTLIIIKLQPHQVQADELIIRNTGNPLDLSGQYGNFEITDSEYQSGRATILLVEDNKAGLSYLSKRLKVNYNVFHALNGSQAIKFLKREGIVPDLIVSDVMMDKMDGYAFAKVLSANNTFNHIPLIFLTAKSAPIDKLKGLSLGAVDWIAKPYSSKELELKIESILEKLSNQQKSLINNMLTGLNISTNSSQDISAQNEIFEANCKLFGLSKREIDVARLVKEDHTSQEIAEILCIASRTVTTHISNIFARMDVNSREDMIKKLLQFK